MKVFEEEVFNSLIDNSTGMWSITSILYICMYSKFILKNKSIFIKL